MWHRSLPVSTALPVSMFVSMFDVEPHGRATVRAHPHPRAMFDVLLGAGGCDQGRERLTLGGGAISLWTTVQTKLKAQLAQTRQAETRRSLRPA